MTDEEMAEEYIKKNNLEWELECNRTSPIGEVKQAFLAGLKVGGPQWHDLRKDKNDLPKKDCQVITVGKSPRRLLIKKVAYYLRSEKKFVIWNKEYENFTKLYNVIAWCEIPEFKEKHNA